MNTEQMDKLNERLTKDITRRLQEVKKAEVDKKAAKKKAADKQREADRSE